MLSPTLEPLFNQLRNQVETPGSKLQGWLEAMETEAERELAAEGFLMGESAFLVVEEEEYGILVKQRKFQDESWTLQSRLELELEGPRDIGISLVISVTRDDEVLNVGTKMNYLAALRICGTLYPTANLRNWSGETLLQRLQEKIRQSEDRLPVGKTVFMTCAGELAWRLQEHVTP